MEDLEEKERDRLGTEWALVVASRELLNIALRREQPATYRQAINFGADIAPSVLAPDRRVLRGVKESEEARYYAELAAAESASTGMPITRLEYIEREIAKLEKGIDALPDDASKLMKSRLATLKRVRQEIRPKNYTENQLIVRDALKVERKLPVSGEGTEYKEYQVDEQRRLRIRVLHPDPPEHKIGADLVYEFYDLEDQTVRIALVQYKLWDGRNMPQDPRMAGQLARMRALGCNGELCKAPELRNGRPPYRFPHCAMFLRPTDSLQHPNAKLVSSGLHIPLCVADESWTKNNRGGLSIRRATVEGQSVSHRMFEDLFNGSFLGSNRLAVVDIEELYKKTGVLDGDESIIIHAQEYAVMPEKLKPKRRKRDDDWVAEGT